MSTDFELKLRSKAALFHEGQDLSEAIEQAIVQEWKRIEQEVEASGGEFSRQAYTQPKSLGELLTKRAGLYQIGNGNSVYAGGLSDYAHSLWSGWYGNRELAPVKDHLDHERLSLLYGITLHQQSRLATTFYPIKASAFNMAENTIIVRTANGLRLRGKQTFGSDALFADELLVFLKQEGEKEPSGIALIPVDAEQLEVQVHSDWTSGVTVHYNDVSVVWERVLVDDNADSVKQLLQNPVAVSLADYQWASRQLELLQIIAGTAIELAENTGLGKELHIQTILGEMIQNIEVLKAFIYNAEEEGALNEAGLFLPAFTPVRAAKQAGGGFIRHALEVLERVSQTFLLESPDPSQAQQQVSREVTSLHNAVWSLVGSGKAYRIKQHESYTFGDLIEQSTLFYEQYNYSYYKELYKKFWRQAAASVP